MKFVKLIVIMLMCCISSDNALLQRRRKKRKVSQLDMQILNAINETYKNSKSINKTLKQITKCTNNNNKHIQCNNTNTSNNNNNNNSNNTQYIHPHIISYPPIRFPPSTHQLHIKPCYLPLYPPHTYPYIYDPIHLCHLCCYNTFNMNPLSLNECYSHCSYSDIINT
jgi:hypothetical protein